MQENKFGMVAKSCLQSKCAELKKTKQQKKKNE